LSTNRAYRTYSFNILLKYLENTQIYLNSSLSGGHEGLPSEAGGWAYRQPCIEGVSSIV
jgi:hypothetical protein